MREGWTKTTLGEVVKQGKGGSWGQDDPADDLIQVVCLRGTDLAELIAGKVPSAPLRWVKESELNKSACSKDMVLIETSGSKCGRSIVLTDEILHQFDLPVIYSNFCRTLSIDISKVTREFVEIWFSNNYENGLIPSYRATSAMPNLDLKAFLRVEQIKIPPLHEQKRIVDLISSVDSYIEALELQAESARKSRSAVLHEILSAGGDGWTETTLGEVSSCAGGSAFPIRYQGSNEGIPFIKVSDMNLPGNEIKIHFASNFISDELAKKLKVRIWPEDTVVFPKVGAALLTNKRRILSESTIFDNNIMGIVSGDKLNPIFLFLFMQTIDMHNYVQNGALPSISNEIVKSIVIFLPPLSEQKRIVDLISSMDNGISATEKLMSDTKQLRSGLLSDLLSGEHEIPQSYDKVMGIA